jgi:hypothetical protein
LAVFLVALPAMAQSGNGDYIFLVASGFLCDLGDSSACPAAVKSAQDDTYELSGVGTLSTRSKSVTATGTFTHKSPDGGLLEMGIWIASDLVNFDSYGIAPGALLHEGITFGAPLMGPRRMPMLSGPLAAGGLAVFRIRLLPMRGGSKTAPLQVNCALGKVPAERQSEGIRLSFEGGGGEFDQELSGRTIFLLTRPGADLAAPAPAPRVDPNGPPTGAKP